MKMNIAVKGSGARVHPCAARLAGRPVSEEDPIRTAVKIVPFSRTMRFEKRLGGRTFPLTRMDSATMEGDENTPRD